MNKIALFDMDGTLTQPRQVITQPTIRALRALSEEWDIGIVSGSDFDYITQQCNFLFDLGGVDLRKIKLFPCNGTKSYIWNHTKFENLKSVDMIDEIGSEAYSYLLQTLFANQLAISCQYNLPFTGTFFHYRGSMLNWCPIGRSAGQRERDAWIEADKKHGIRKYFMESIEEMIQEKSFNLSVALGGSTSLDIYPMGWDKSYVLDHLDEYENVIFFGDKCGQGGNDYELYELLKDGESTQSYAVTDPEHTIKIIKEDILKTSV